MLCCVQVDFRIRHLVAEMVWPLKRYACIAELQQLGRDGLVRLVCKLQLHHTILGVVHAWSA